MSSNFGAMLQQSRYERVWLQALKATRLEEHAFRVFRRAEGGTQNATCLGVRLYL
jgi:hypothetical protein